MPQPAVLPVKGAAVGLHLLLGAGTVPPFLCLEGPSLSAAPGCFPAECLLLDSMRRRCWAGGCGLGRGCASQIWSARDPRRRWGVTDPSLV